MHPRRSHPDRSRTRSIANTLALSIEKLIMLSVPADLKQPIHAPVTKLTRSHGFLKTAFRQTSTKNARKHDGRSDLAHRCTEITRQERYGNRWSVYSINDQVRSRPITRHLRAASLDVDVIAKGHVPQRSGEYQVDPKRACFASAWWPQIVKKVLMASRSMLRAAPGRVEGFPFPALEGSSQRQIDLGSGLRTEPRIGSIAETAGPTPSWRYVWR
jgi:hypothetical protein